jgi:hypothetical protein
VPAAQAIRPTLALETKSTVQEVSYAELRERLLADGQVLHLSGWLTGHSAAPHNAGVRTLRAEEPEVSNDRRAK